MTMLLLGLALAAASSSASQNLAGPAFETFARAADRHCPSQLLRDITPGDLSWEQETFDAQLPAGQRARLARADRQERACAGRNGLSCPTTHTLAAMLRTGMLPSFVHYACAHPAPVGVVREPAAAARSPAPGSMAGEFGLLCLNGPSSAEAIRRRASEDGWRPANAGAAFTKTGNEGVLTLKVTDGRSAGETREICSISVAHAMATTVRAMQTLLGFGPALDLGTSATFFARRDAAGWRSGAGLDDPAFQEAKREGGFYSIVATTGDTSSRMMALHVMAASD